MKLTPSELGHYLECDFFSGTLTWKVSTNRRVKIRSQAGCKIDASGRRFLGLKGQQILVHHAVWALAYGYWPTEIDHINRDPSDNRLTNLREVTHAQNAKNKGVSSRNKSGFKGVSFSKNENKYAAHIGHNNKTIRIGSYSTPELAAAAYDEKALELHKNFAVTNKTLGLI